MGGWKSPMTVLTCYQQPDTETQREALAKRKRYRRRGRVKRVRLTLATHSDTHPENSKNSKAPVSVIRCGGFTQGSWPGPIRTADLTLISREAAMPRATERQNPLSD